MCLTPIVPHQNSELYLRLREANNINAKTGFVPQLQM